MWRKRAAQGAHNLRQAMFHEGRNGRGRCVLKPSPENAFEPAGVRRGRANKGMHSIHMAKVQGSRLVEDVEVRGAGDRDLPRAPSTGTSKLLKATGLRHASSAALRIERHSGAQL